MFREEYTSFPGELSRVSMTDPEFRKLSRFIHDGYGIKLPDGKKVMLQARLQKRLRELNLASYSEYFELIFGRRPDHGEMIRMIDSITTNKTDFFRESVHMDYLRDNILPEFVRQGGNRFPLKIWSAGCSSGEEPYSIAMCISEFSRASGSLDYRILGTDLSTRVLRQATDAVYTDKKIADIPFAMRTKYLLKGKDNGSENFTIIPELRRKVYFKRLNFMDRYYDIQGKYDVVFCRNVLIYFERSVQESVINKICSYIPAGGYFFLGHSESIMGMDVPLRQIKPTVYHKI